MKLTALFLLSFMLGTFSATCSDGCDDEQETHSYELAWQTADEHGADTCSPFCGCSCCQSLSVQTSFQIFSDDDIYQPFSEQIYLNAPDSPGTSIWQPPRH